MYISVVVCGREDIDGVNYGSYKEAFMSET